MYLAAFQLFAFLCVDLVLMFASKVCDCSEFCFYATPMKLVNIINIILTSLVCQSFPIILCCIVFAPTNTNQKCP